MSRRIILSTVILILFVLSNTGAQTKIAFVNSDIIIGQLPEAQAIKKKIEDLTKLYQDTISQKENDIKTKADEFKTRYEDAQKQVEAGNLKPDQVKLLESEISQMQQDIQKMDQDLAEYKQGIQQTLLQTQQEMFKPVKDKITGVIEQVAKEMKFSIVLDKAGDAVLYGDKELDITFKVLDKLK